MIFSQLEQEMKYRMLVIEGAAIVEAGYNKYYHEMWCTQLDKEIAIGRLLARDDRLTDELAHDRVNIQIDDEERLKHCNFSLDMTRGLETSYKILDEKIHEYNEMGILTSVEKENE